MNKCSICGGSLVPFRTDEGFFEACNLCKTPELYTETFLQSYVLAEGYIERRGLKDSLLTAKSILLSSM